MEWGYRSTWGLALRTVGCSAGEIRKQFLHIKSWHDHRKCSESLFTLMVNLVNKSLHTDCTTTADVVWVPYVHLGSSKEKIHSQWNTRRCTGMLIYWVIHAMGVEVISNIISKNPPILPVYYVDAIYSNLFNIKCAWQHIYRCFKVLVDILTALFTLLFK